MLFAIRDDDVSFWTNPDDLEKLYAPIFKENIKISFSIIPFAVRSHNQGNRSEFYQESLLKPIGENKKLIIYLKDKIKANQVSLMLHGFSHQYKVKVLKTGKSILPLKHELDKLKQKALKYIFLGEYNWKSYKKMLIETKQAKEYLEDLFKVKISIFVPPSNDISRAGIKAVSKCNLNISGSIYLKKFNRPVCIHSLKNWLLKLWYKLRYSKKYPYIMHYKSHKELCSYGLVPGVNFQTLKEQFNFCKRKKAPFILAVHYWETLKNPEIYKTFFIFLNYIKNQNLKFLFVEEVFNNLCNLPD